MFRTRQLIVRMRTALKNNIHGQLFRMGYVLDEEASDLFSPKGRAVLEALKLPPEERQMMDRKLAVLDDIGEHIGRMEKGIRKELLRDERAQWLMSLPGVGEIIAYGILAEIGVIERFPDRRALAAYAGLLPLSCESAEKDFGRHTSGQCNRFLRWMMIEAVTGAIRTSRRMKSLHARVRARNPERTGKARVAVARELLELAWILLRRGERYREKRPVRPGSQARQAGANARDKTNQTHPNRASQMPLYAGSARSKADL
jgi:transposase